MGSIDGHSDHRDRADRSGDDRGRAGLHELGPRLRAIAERVPEGVVLADLCCDHARLAAALVAEGRVPRAIAGDIHAGPLAAAAKTLAQAGVGDRVELRLGDGLRVLAVNEVDAIVIAGIGAPLAERLLSEGRDRLVGVRRLIVQANQGFPKLGSLRARVTGLGFGLVDERVVEDRGRVYVILVAEPDPHARLVDLADRELGPILRHRRDPETLAWFAHERDRVGRACAGMSRGQIEPEALAGHRRVLALLEQVAASPPW